MPKQGDQYHASKMINMDENYSPFSFISRELKNVTILLYSKLQNLTSMLNSQEKSKQMKINSNSKHYLLRSCDFDI